MDILTFSEKLQSGIKEKLTDLNVEQDDIFKIGSALTLARENIRKLKSFVLTYTFKNDEEEIKFFKEIKPVFVSQVFYHEKVFHLRLMDSFRDSKTKLSRYFELLKSLERFAVRNPRFYEYCMTNSSQLDKQYFTRTGKKNMRVDVDESFSTGFDSKLGKILANELLKKYVLNAIQKLQSGSETDCSPSLNWTGSKTALIELIYALKYVEVFNNGSVDIKFIASAFEKLFNINLGNYYRIFLDIRARKSGQTNFLDELKKGFIERMNDGLNIP